MPYYRELRKVSRQGKWEDHMHIVSSQGPVIPLHSGFTPDTLTTRESALVEAWDEPVTLYRELNLLIQEIATRNNLSSAQREVYEESMRRKFRDTRKRRYSAYFAIMELRAVLPL